MKKIVSIAAHIILGAIIMAMTMGVFYMLVLLAGNYIPNVAWIRLLTLVPITLITASFELALINLNECLWRKVWRA